MANHKLSCPMLEGGLSVNLNHLKSKETFNEVYPNSVKFYSNKNSCQIILVYYTKL